jgi:hypothetical protein
MDLGSDCDAVLSIDYKIVKADGKGKKHKSLNR